MLKSSTASFLCLCAAALFAGCGLVRDAAEVPGQAVGALVPGRDKQVEPAALQQRLIRFADDAINQFSNAIENYMRENGREQDVLLALESKLAFGSLFVTIATGPNPNVALIDLLAATTFARTGMEFRIAQDPENQRFLPILEIARAIETNAWSIARDVLQQTESDELRVALEAWANDHTAPSISSFARPQDDLREFRTALAAKQSKDKGNSLFSFLTLDPVTGLDPAVREVTASRLFAERAMFSLQKMPLLLRWQIELLSFRLLAQPELKSVVASTAKIAESADRLSKASENLPESISAALDKNQGAIGKLNDELRRTIIALESASASLNETFTTFDKLMERFGVGVPKEEKEPRDPNRKPFNVLDYAHTADRISAAARDLDQTLVQLRATIDSEELKNATAGVTADAREVIHHAGWIAAGIVALIFAGILLLRVTRPRARSTL